jgi:hypothetical protein
MARWFVIRAVSSRIERCRPARCIIHPLPSLPGASHSSYGVTTQLAQRPGSNAPTGINSLRPDDEPIHGWYRFV